MSEDKTGNQSSIGVLQEKIRNQAKRLCSFQEYISICEKRLLQYNPNENLPLNKHSLKKPVQVNQQDLQKKYNDLMNLSNDSTMSTVSSLDVTKEEDLIIEKMKIVVEYLMYFGWICLSES